jgi:hypothetical protein
MTFWTLLYLQPLDGFQEYGNRFVRSESSPDNACQGRGRCLSKGWHDVYRCLSLHHLAV